MLKDELLKAGLGSAVESTRQRASDSKGRREESESRECRAASLAEEAAREGGGDGSCRRSSSEIGELGKGDMSSDICGPSAVAVD